MLTKLMGFAFQRRFFVLFGLAWLAARRPVVSMLGWLLHIAIDVFTHRGLFATHFLWPLSSLAWDGTPWENPWLLGANYVTLAAVYLLLFGSARSAGRQQNGSRSAESPGPSGK